MLLAKLAGAMKGNLTKAAGLFQAPLSQVARLAPPCRRRRPPRHPEAPAAEAPADAAPVDEAPAEAAPAADDAAADTTDTTTARPPKTAADAASDD